MNPITSLVKNVIAVETVALAGLFMAGLGLTLAQGDQYTGRTFYSYGVNHLDQTPAWFAAALALSAINGFWLFRLALLEGGIGTPSGGPWGQYSVVVPVNHLRLFAISLIAIPALLAAFILARSLNF